VQADGVSHVLHAQRLSQYTAGCAEHCSAEVALELACNKRNCDPCEAGNIALQGHPGVGPGQLYWHLS